MKLLNLMQLVAAAALLGFLLALCSCLVAAVLQDDYTAGAMMLWLALCGFICVSSARTHALLREELWHV